jgi:hypothetical protein
VRSLRSPDEARLQAARVLLRRLAELHGCPPDCPHCAGVEANHGVPQLLSDFSDFVRSRDGLRLVGLCVRSGRPFPKLSNDEVTQFCIEEALFERFAFNEKRANETAFLEAQERNQGPAVDPAHQEALDRARSFADTGVA